MPHTQLFYHLVWTTKNREALLTPDVEPEVYGYLRSKAVGLEAVVFALNGSVDHVHLVAAIPAKIAVARFVGQIKAIASTRFNQAHPDGPTFFWQSEYGAFTFDGKRLPNYIAYVERQKEHHADRTIIPLLERTTGGGVMVREPAVGYGGEDAEWRRDLEVQGRAWGEGTPGHQCPG